MPASMVYVQSSETDTCLSPDAHPARTFNVPVVAGTATTASLVLSTRVAVHLLVPPNVPPSTSSRNWIGLAPENFAFSTSEHLIVAPHASSVPLLVSLTDCAVDACAAFPIMVVPTFRSLVHGMWLGCPAARPASTAPHAAAAHCFQTMMGA